MHLDRLDAELLSDTYGKPTEEKLLKNCPCMCGCARKILDLDDILCKFCRLEKHINQHTTKF